MKLLVLDNYDSFTYNLVHQLRELNVSDVAVFRNDQISIADVDKYSHIILSPGPGLPCEAGIMPELIKTYAATKVILGVCLGHQAIAEAFSGKLQNLGKPVHGKATVTKVLDKEDPIFKGIPESFKTGRYHSWVVDKTDFPAELIVTAEDEEGYIMALRHRTLPLHGVQFHPESVLTEHGLKLISNWLSL